MAGNGKKIFVEGVRPKSASGPKPQSKGNPTQRQGGAQPKTSPGPKPGKGNKGN